MQLNGSAVITGQASRELGKGKVGSDVARSEGAGEDARRAEGAVSRAKQTCAKTLVAGAPSRL
jgi:hypothetical protein